MTDLISRQMALEMLNDNELVRQADDVFDGDLHRYKRAAQRIIAQLPTIEPKRGKWTRHVLKNANVPWGYDCSACGAWFVVGEDTVEKYYYCPNCGAKM